MSFWSSNNVIIKTWRISPNTIKILNSDNQSDNLFIPRSKFPISFFYFLARSRAPVCHFSSKSSLLFGSFDMPYKKYKKKGVEGQGVESKQEEKSTKAERGREGMRNTSRQSESFELALLMSWMDVCWGGEGVGGLILRAGSKAKWEILSDRAARLKETSYDASEPWDLGIYAEISTLLLCNDVRREVVRLSSPIFFPILFIQRFPLASTFLRFRADELS